MVILFNDIYIIKMKGRGDTTLEEEQDLEGVYEEDDHDKAIRLLQLLRAFEQGERECRFEREERTLPKYPHMYL
jgi:hypothetical protein